MAKHQDLTGAALHVPGYVQSSDPGAVGAGVLWVDNTAPTAPIFKIRNAANSGWTTPAAGASALTGLSDIVITSPANGDVLTYDSGSGEWKNAAGGGGGGGGGAWTTVVKASNQATTSTSYVNDTDLVTPTLPAGKYRVRVSLFFSAVGSGGFQLAVDVPSNSFVRGRGIHQDAGSGSLGSAGNVGAAVPSYNNGNVGNGWVECDFVITTTGSGVVQVKFHAQNGGNTATIMEGAFLEYLTF